MSHRTYHMLTNFRTYATILLKLSVNIIHVCYLVVSRSLPLVAKYAICCGSQFLIKRRSKVQERNMSCERPLDFDQ